MKLFCRREIQGAISLFLVVIMLPMMVFSALLVDTARYHLAKSMVASAGDLALNGALADYDAILKDVYGLFAMSQADDVAKNVKEYFEQTVISYGVVGEEDAGEYVSALLGKIYEYLLVEDKEVADFLDMTVSDSKVKAQKVAESSLANPQMLEKQIVEYMKYRAPVDFGLSFLDSLSAFTKVEEQTDVVQAQVNAQSSLQDAADKNYALYQAARAYDERYNVLEPDPVPERVHLKNYGHIFTVEYVEEYRKLHRMTMLFCSAAYLGEWDLPDSNRSTEDFFLLSSGNYIVQEGDQRKVSGHLADTNTNFGADSSSPLGEVNTFLEKDAGNVEAGLSGYGADRKIQEPLPDLGNEAEWDRAVREFQEVDAFYKAHWKEYAEALRKLDRYAAAMEAYSQKIAKEITDLESEQKEAKEEKEKAQEEVKNLLSQQADAKGRLESYSQEEQSAAESYRKNAKELEELKSLSWTEQLAARDRISSLEEENQDICDTYQKDGEDIISQMVQDMETQESCGEQAEEWNKKRTEAEVQEKSLDSRLKEKKEQKKAKEDRYQEILGRCEVKVNAFNADARNYREYKRKVEAVVTERALKVSQEFRLLYDNVRSLEQLLAQVEEKFAQAQGAIHTYTENVESWDSANNAYAGGGEDNFSQVQSSGIREAENVFSEEEVAELPGKVREEHEKLTLFLQELDANFVYMGREQIKEITDARQIADAIRRSSEGGAVKTRYVEQKALASPADCDGIFSLTHEMDGGRLDNLAKLTEPVPCCAFMNYLHQTYQEQYGLDKTGGTKVLTEAQKKDKDTYKQAKGDNLTKKVEEAVNEPECDLGYQYQKVTEIGGSGYPSGGNGGSGGTGEKSGQTDKDGLAANKSAASSALGGLGTALENGRDKLYVMAYLFDNFSYRTLVQDLAREEGKDPSWFNCGREVYGNYVDSVKYPAAYTGGKYHTYPINALNNKIYGAEIEYVLYGNRNPSVNVGLTSASIYAVRVLFNAVYAFTSSDIRNQTRTVAVGVQAATCGMVPYQVVQVVLQLALAMGESVIDLKNMEAGAKVAVVKSKDTWTLSMEGIKNLAKGTLKTLGRNAVEKAAKLAESKINQIVDAGADKLSECVQGIEGDLTKMADHAAEEILDNAFAQIDAVVDEVMNQMMDELFYGDDSLLDPNLSREAVTDRITSAFGSVKSQLAGRIGEVLGEMGQGTDSPLISACCEAAQNLTMKALDGIEDEFRLQINQAGEKVDPRSVAYQQIYTVKLKISEKVEEQYKDLLSNVSGKVQGKITEASNEIKQFAGKQTEEAKKAVTDKINDFVDDMSFGSTRMETGSLSQVNGNAADSSTKASSIAFGYSDYLRLFLFIGLCADNQSGSMICRIGDLIQLNLSSAPEGSQLAHRSGSKFSMAEAKTYISLEAEVDLKLIFLNLGVFKRQVESFNEEYEEEDRIDLEETMGIRYLGIVGY